MALNERPRGFGSDPPIGSSRARGSLQTLKHSKKPENFIEFVMLLKYQCPT